MGNIGTKHRILYRQREAASMQLTNTILKKELLEQWQEVQELKRALILRDKAMLPIKDMDPQETIRFIRKENARRFN